MKSLAPILLLLCAAPLRSGVLMAQTNVAPSAPGAALAGLLPGQLGRKCPIDSFRELLAKPEAERARLLAARSLVSQKLIQAKIREYEALSPEQRDLRLRATELRWYLLPLMSTPATNRPAQLALIPDQVRPLVQDRLQLWDKLPPDAQKRLLEPALVRFANPPLTPADRMAEVRERISPRKLMIDRGIERWQQMSEEQREETAKHFYQFFDLTPRERARTLQTLSEPERAQLEKTLRAYQNLSDDQRERCVESFEKFASLSPDERQQFLENVERWKLMTPTERETWKLLVEKVSRPHPPFPPGLARLRAARHSVATNSD